jgi:uncharacterized protein (DUF983 family)
VGNGLSAIGGKMSDKSIWTGIRRGLSGRCPSCGEGRLFAGFLNVSKRCQVCGADNSIYPSDDMPPYLTILLSGHLVVPIFMFVDFTYMPALWLQFAIWPALTVALCLLLLPPVKGGVVGLCWAADIVRQDRAA